MPRTKTLRWNPDIDWLINDAPAALGERGSPPGPGCGRSAMTDNYPYIERAHRAMGSVIRERDLRAIAGLLTRDEWGCLVEYYQRRNSCHVFGAVAAFSDSPVASTTHAGGAFVALLLADRAGEGAELRIALGAQGKSQSVPIISRYRRLVADTIDAAHGAWSDSARALIPATYQKRK